MILIVFGIVALLICLYALFAMLTTKREHFLKIVDGDGLAFISLLAWMLVFIAGSAYLIFKGFDPDAANNFRRYVHSFTGTYFFEGALCLLLTYGFSQVSKGKSDGLKRTLIIAGGILLGLLPIVLGLLRLLNE